METHNYRQKLNRLMIKYQTAVETVKREQALLAEAEDSLSAAREAQSIGQSIAQGVQRKANASIAAVVTRCLQAVFDEPYEFEIRFDQKRGRTEASKVFLRGGLELDDPLNQVGGGVIDVASLALRLCSIMMSKPPKSRVVILDEPFKNIRGEENKARTRDLLVKLSEELDFQFIINTDIPSYQLGTVLDMG